MGANSDATVASSLPPVKLSYQLLRNTTSPDEQSTGVKSFVVNLPALEMLKLGTRDNLRNYIAEYNPRQRNRVHNAIRNTIESEPARFITRNSGFVISASAIDVDDDKKTVVLTDASILNGAQSQGELRRWAAEADGGEEASLKDTPFYVRAEIIVDTDSAQVVETAIARNTATPVKSITQVGGRGQLDGLQESMQARHPGMEIQQSETDYNKIDTRKLLQYARLLMPVSVSLNDSSAEKLRAYKTAEQCLTDFSTWCDLRGSDPAAAEKYRFTVDIAPVAWDEYGYWESHEAWNGHRLWEENKKGRACRRDRNGKVVWVSAGLVFPIMSALSSFVVERDGQWVLAKPRQFDPVEMIAVAVSQFRNIGSDPMLMGRSAGVYDNCRLYPRMLTLAMKTVEDAGA